MKVKERKRPRLTRLVKTIWSLSTIDNPFKMDYNDSYLYIEDFDGKWQIEYNEDDRKERIFFTTDEWKTSKEITINDVKKIAKNDFFNLIYTI